MSHEPAPGGHTAPGPEEPAPNPHEPQVEGETNTSFVVSVAILFMISLLLFNEVLLNMLKKAQTRAGGIFKYLNATMVTTGVGLAAGALLNFVIRGELYNDLRSSFSDIFLIILLPPIIFESAISMESEMFFKNFGTILSFALTGTTIATIISAYLLYNISWFGIQMDIPLLVCFAFGSLISATDPVAVLNIFKTLNADKMLYFIIFGESIINDAIAIIYYETTVEIFHAADIGVSEGIRQFMYIFFGSISVGFFIGLICAGILKSEKRSSRHEVDNIETIITVTVPWASYLIAFPLKLSGIVCIMFCGIAMGRYALPNLSGHGHHLMHLFYHGLGYTFESLTFIFIGIVFMTYGLAYDLINFKFFIVVTIILIFSRLINVVIISSIQNCQRTKNVITVKHLIVLWYSGFRGAMATALALSAVQVFNVGRFGELFLILTLLTAGLNIYLQGIFLEPLMHACGVIRTSSTDYEQQPEEEIPTQPGLLKKIISAIDQQIFWELLVIKSKKDDNKKDSHENLEEDHGIEMQKFLDVHH